ncbi:MAG: nitroreductase family deazaflavin-dependent oxidoreductase [Actinomycetota bacterium]|nr:nitroreductase family deazaflavin-dependent oxidoreductase [Actinomycetota bacterium]
MSDMNDWNSQIITEFRANEGRVGGQFAGAPMTLLHHVGRKSGREFVAPVMYLAEDGDLETIYVFASKAGAPTDPDWYANLVAAGRTTVEVGSETYSTTVSEVTGDERDRIYAAQAAKYPGFAEYEQLTAGIRTIPVLALHRV